MSGQSDLQQVLNSLRVSCDDQQYGFSVVEVGSDVSVNEILGFLREDEGLTIVANIDYLKSKNLDYEGPFAKLTVNSHTSLDLVGLTALLTAKLTEAKVPANIIAGYYHDHIFVKYDLRQDAMETINKLAKK